MTKKIYEEIELDLDGKTIDGLCAFALEKIANDKEALVNYAANIILQDVVDNPKKFKEMAEKIKNMDAPMAHRKRAPKKTPKKTRK